MSKAQQNRNKELALDNAAMESIINGKSAEIERLKAELAEGGAQWAKDMAFYSQQVHDLKAELAAARAEHEKDDNRIMEMDALIMDQARELAKLRALCARMKAKLDHGDFEHSASAECGCDLCVTKRWLDDAAAGRGEGKG